jgi:hypothetical protein
MSNPLQEPLSVLCEEVGVPTPAPDAKGIYHLVIDGQELRLLTLNTDRVIMLGVLGKADTIAEHRHENRQLMLANCLALQAVRFGKLATLEVLTIEPETDELVLWRGFESYTLTIPTLLAAAESLLNELEFWKIWLSSR